MPAPFDWLTAQAVALQLQLDLADGDPLPPRAEQARLGAAAYVERVRADLAWDAAPVTASPDVVMGAAILASRLHARAGSPLGLASFAEFGASAVLRLDPDVERLLGLGRYAKPAVG